MWHCIVEGCPQLLYACMMGLSTNLAWKDGWMDDHIISPCCATKNEKKTHTTIIWIVPSKHFSF
jgi:hypothetical protein